MKINNSNTNNLTKEQKEAFLEQALDELHKYLKTVNFSLEYMSDYLNKLRQEDNDKDDNQSVNNSDNSKTF